MILDAIIALSIVIGSVFTLVGAIGLARFGDLYSRLHGPTKATTLGLFGLLTGSVLYFSTRQSGVSVHEVLVTIFLFLTAPVSAHMLARAGLHLRVRSLAAPLEERYRVIFPGAVAPVPAERTPAPEADAGDEDRLT
jgi:multicomponent K+:H+ antiporter subunit G